MTVTFILQWHTRMCVCIYICFTEWWWWSRGREKEMNGMMIQWWALTSYPPIHHGWACFASSLLFLPLLKVLESSILCLDCCIYNIMVLANRSRRIKSLLDSLIGPLNSSVDNFLVKLVLVTTCSTAVFVYTLFVRSIDIPFLYILDEVLRWSVSVSIEIPIT